MDDIATADIDFFSFFLKQGVDPNIFDRVGSIELMIVAAIRIFFCSLQDGYHPLAHTTYSGRQDLVEVLIEHGADVDLATKVRNAIMY